MRFNTGLCSISFRDRSVFDIVDAVKKASLDAVEWGSDVHAPVGSGRIDGAKCSSYGTYFKLGVTPICELESYIETARVLGTDILRLWCGACGSGECSDKNALFDICREASAIAEREGVTLCMECHQGTYTDTAESSLELMREVDSDNFRMYWQPNQYRTVEENIASAKAVAPFVKNIHVFNWEGDKKYPLIEAVDTWKRYLELFGSGTLLLEFMPDGRLESLEREAEALFKITEGI
ncbi:MAG: sugar phosphate isomerase/epimerase [Clostridia bacterium]|nr:sugar phosphate isomerase/epimerase [Clostridia bacterium]